MATTGSPIRLLPVEAQLQLKSSVALNSLNDVVVGLIKNALDAQAQKIYIGLDYLRGNCCVEDDGVGIPAAEFEAGGGLGLMHYTSKFTDIKEIHGHCGRFLASLSASSLLHISSRQIAEESESTLVYHHSRLLTRQCNVAEKEQKVGGRHGTRVIVRDLFGNLAVRMKQRALHFGNTENNERELERLKLRITAVALAWPQNVRVVVSDQQAQETRKFALGGRGKAGGHDHKEVSSRRTSTFRLDQICTILSRAGYITPTDFDSWTTVSARTSQLCVRAAICLQPAPSKHVQFISLGIHPLDYSSTLCHVLYVEVNSLFAESAFGAVEDDFDVPEEERLRRLKDRRFKNDGPTDRQLKGKGKGADRWPMFYIRIDPQDSNLPVGVLRSDEDDKQAARFFEKTVQLIVSMIHRFLQERHFQPRTRRRRGGVRAILSRSNTTSQGSNGPADSRCAGLSAKGNSQMAVDHTTELGSNPAILDPSERQKTPQKFPSATAFCSWSRIKSGNPHAVEGLLSGLPRSALSVFLPRNSSEPNRCSKVPTSCAKKDLQHDNLIVEHLDEDIQLLLRDLTESPDTETGNHRGVMDERPLSAPQPMTAEDHKNSFTLEGHDSDDGIIVWKNLVSGECIRINSRTGLSLPTLPFCSTKESQASASAQTAGNGLQKRGILRQRGIDSHEFDVGEKPWSEPNNWLSSVIAGWQNPVFRLGERPIPSTIIENEKLASVQAGKCCHSKYRHCTDSDAVGCDNRLSKAGLAGARVLGQVDMKFILAIIRASRSEKVSEACSDIDNNALVLIDQHAADERCRVEELYADISTGTGKMAVLTKPIIFEVTARDSQLFCREQTYFETWGISYEVGNGDNCKGKNTQAVRPASARPHSKKIQADKSHKWPASAVTPATSAGIPARRVATNPGLQVTVHALPEPIAERCRLDPKLLINILRSEAWARTDNHTRPYELRPATPISVTQADDKEISPLPWLTRISSCPRRIIDLLNSRACRSAIMFNDKLTQPECEELVKRLAQCAFPFQCAHGRPSMVVLGKLQENDFPISGCRPMKDYPPERIMDDEGKEKKDFLEAFTTWQSRTRGAA
ncbi:hypothetical protein EPUS_01457 [Endocarpon pusillum Z07020]|uniref:MutL C-terminal dimerisation domain-containing protein n=1 Tax=Endocarpon pusillum (strain Z07020 / HMAS-L-300199) TaxID=1263415 RepID=U1I2E8_ENDPU|nr:uncharacterized protein EPUS_01457 [Endocarpon pusillum Z07020]ERF76124.1 hypothetical protein EPUS_01457 [Endocarpon pusillum Z07020]